MVLSAVHVPSGLFALGIVGGQEPGQFVTLPFKTWTKMVLKASTHATKEYYQSAMTTMRDFIAWYEDPSLSVATMLDSQVQRMYDRLQPQGD